MENTGHIKKLPIMTPIPTPLPSRCWTVTDQPWSCPFCSAVKHIEDSCTGHILLSIRLHPGLIQILKPRPWFSIHDALEAHVPNDVAFV